MANTKTTRRLHRLSRRLLAALTLLSISRLSLGAIGAPGNASPTQEAIEQIRQRLLLHDASLETPAGLAHREKSGLERGHITMPLGSEHVAQWFNFPNWPNFMNWSKWPNWRNF